MKHLNITMPAYCSEKKERPPAFRPVGMGALYVLLSLDRASTDRITMIMDPMTMLNTDPYWTPVTKLARPASTPSINKYLGISPP
jgi:hypothetical protein